MLSENIEKATVDGRRIGPVDLENRRGNHVFLHSVDEAGKGLDITVRPELGPLVVGSTPEEYRILSGNDAGQVLAHHFVKFRDEFVRKLGNPVE